MAKQARFYPNIPRVDRPKDVKRPGAIMVKTPVYTPKERHADNLSKQFNVYTGNWINESTKEYQGDNTRAGTKNPGWRVTIAKGGDATSAYQRECYKLKPMKYRITSETATSISRGYGTAYGGILIVENDKLALEDIAIGRLRNRLSGKVGNAQLGPPLAESREIHRLVRQINGLGMKTFRALLAAKATKGKSLASQFGDIWLGFGFGVNPLLKDTQQAVDSILKYVTRQNYRTVITGTSSRDYASSANLAISSSDAISSHCNLGWYLNASHWQGVRYRAGVDIKVRAGSSYSVTDRKSVV